MRKKKGKDTYISYSVTYRITSAIYGTLSLLLVFATLYAFFSDAAAEASIFAYKEAYESALSNPITYVLFGGFMISAAVIYITTMRIHRMQMHLDEATIRNNVRETNLGDVARSLWNPINLIAENTATIMMENEDEEIKEDLLAMAEANEEISTVVNEMVDFSMIASQTMTIDQSPYDLGVILHECYDAIQVQLQQKKLSLLIHCDEHIPAKLLGDAPRIQQIVTSLLSNSIKYTDDGAVTLDITMEPLFAGDICLVLTIRDTGRGMKREAREHLFDLYNDTGAQGSVEWTGLGLAIIKRLLELMKGTVSVDSEVGGGTVFVVRIPQRVYDVAEIGKIDF